MIKDLKIRTSIVCNLSFRTNNILLCFFYFFFLIELCLIPAVIAQIFVSNAELLIPTGTQTTEASAEIEMEPVTVETRISNFST